MSAKINEGYEKNKTTEIQALQPRIRIWFSWQLGPKGKV